MAVLIVVAVFLVVTGVTSHVLGSRTSEYRCRVASVSQSRLRDGTASWKVGTNCGGTLYIGQDGTTQTGSETAALARELQPGGVYDMTVKGVLRNPLFISAYLLRAVPAR